MGPATGGANPDEGSGEADAAVDEAKVLKARADAMGVLIRAGVESKDAARIAGISDVKFVDGRPITLKYADEK